MYRLQNQMVLVSTALNNGTSIVLAVQNQHTIVNLVTYYIKRTSARSVALYQKINVNLMLFTKMITKRIKKKVI
jgi:hypothetical protein